MRLSAGTVDDYGIAVRVLEYECPPERGVEGVGEDRRAADDHLIITVVAFNMIGDAIRDSLAVRLQRP
jgi:hypothetical protein